KRDLRLSTNDVPPPIMDDMPSRSASAFPAMEGRVFLLPPPPAFPTTGMFGSRDLEPSSQRNVAGSRESGVFLMPDNVWSEQIAQVEAQLNEIERSRQAISSKLQN